MNSVSCFEVERNLWRYIDRELSAGELSGISSHLKLCEGCRSLYYERSREARQYRLAFPETPFGEVFVSKVVKRMKEEGLFSSSPGPGASTQAGAGSSLPLIFLERRYRRAIAIAAMLLLIPVVVLVGIIFNGSMSGRPAARSVARSLGTMQYENRGTNGGTKLKPRDLLPGSSFEVLPEQTLRIRLGSPERPNVAQMELRGPGRFTLDDQATLRDFKASLEEGKLGAKVSKRAPGDSFVLRTPHAVATVVGTQFMLDVTSAWTDLKVEDEEGKVDYRARAALPGQGTVQVTKKTGPYRVRYEEPLPVPVNSIKDGKEEADDGSDGGDGRDALGSTATEAEPAGPGLDGDSDQPKAQDGMEESPQEGGEEDSPGSREKEVPENLDNPVEK